MLAFRSLDPFRALREPDRRRRDEERLSRSEQRTLSKTQNNHLTGKAPYKFESGLLQRRVSRPAKVTPAQKAEARRRRAQGATLAELARSSGVGAPLVYEREEVEQGLAALLPAIGRRCDSWTKNGPAGEGYTDLRKFLDTSVSYLRPR
jgi:hypothetical protein